MKAAKKAYPENAIAEIRQIREEIVAHYKGDLHAMCMAAMRRQKASGRKVVNLSNRKRRPAAPARA